MKLDEIRIAVIGLGYVGLPLAAEFGKQLDTIGFDIDQNRVEQLIEGFDSTKECNSEELAEATFLKYSTNVEDIGQCNVFIVTVPTPIDEHKQPDLKPLIDASKMLGKIIPEGSIVIYESTVYPGATEEVCIPEIEKVSGMVFNKDFYAGYSPERINPGDKEHRVANILKVTSGSTPEIADFVDHLYKKIIAAGTHKAPSIKVAEASKVIENVQRDVNIALINELHQIFTKLGINSNDVIDASATKWNFMKLYPGLVGGHCIGVDPYYLLHKSQVSGFVPDLMRKAREINDSMPSFVVDDFLLNLIKRKISPIDLKVVLLGFSFKENCPDLRNTKVFELYRIMKGVGFEVEIYDPIVDKALAKSEYEIDIVQNIKEVKASIAFLAVCHDEIKAHCLSESFDYIYDFKGLLSVSS